MVFLSRSSAFARELSDNASKIAVVVSRVMLFFRISDLHVRFCWENRLDQRLDAGQAKAQSAGSCSHLLGTARPRRVATSVVLGDCRAMPEFGHRVDSSGPMGFHVGFSISSPRSEVTAFHFDRSFARAGPISD